MVVVCPTITAEDPDEYAAQLARVEKFATRLHIDVADQIFTGRTLLPPSQIYLPKDKMCDIHVMLAEPMRELVTLISLRPHLVVLHAEAKGNLDACMNALHQAGIKVGIAMLPETEVDQAIDLVRAADYVLIFAGHLGYQGGQAELGQTRKIAAIRKINPKAEIAWDGGVSDQNIAQLVAAGAQVLDVGGFIHKAEDPAKAYATLLSLAQGPPQYRTRGWPPTGRPKLF